MAQSGVLWVPRVQLIRGLTRTMNMADLSADGRSIMPQVSSTVGREFRWKLIPTDAKLEESAIASVGIIRANLRAERQVEGAALNPAGAVRPLHPITARGWIGDLRSQSHDLDGYAGNAKTPMQSARFPGLPAVDCLRRSQEEVTNRRTTVQPRAVRGSKGLTALGRRSHCFGVLS